MADTNRVSLRYVAESAWGVTPANPAFTEIPFVSETLGPTKETVESNTLRSDRNKAALIQVGQSAGGEVNFELTEALADFIESALQAAWTTVSKSGSGVGAAGLAGAVTLTASTQALTFANQTDFDAYKGARLIKVSGAATAGNNGTKAVTGRNDATKTITLAAGSIVADGSSVTTGAMVIAAKYAANGVTKKSYTLEQFFADVGVYQRFEGARVDSFNIGLASKAVITAGVGFKAKGLTTDNAALSGAAVTAATALIPASASADVAAILDGSAALSTGVTALNIKLSNNHRERPIVGSLYSDDLGTGECSVEGDFSAYFYGTTVLAKFLAHTTAALSARINLPSGKTLNLYVPQAHLATDDVSTSGKNQEVTEKVSWKAQYDATYAATIVVDLI